MKDKIADWYRSISLDPSSEFLQNRITLIEKIVGGYHTFDFLDSIKIFFNFPVEKSELIESIVSNIREFDISFSQINNSIDFRLINGALLYYCIFNSKIDKNEKIFLAQCLACTQFPNQQYKPLINSILDDARGFLNNESTKLREFAELEEIDDTKLKIEFKENAGSDWAVVGNQFEVLKSHTVALNKKYIKLRSYLEASLMSQKEETNIIWWLNGNYSNDYNNTIDSYKKEEIVLIVAKELADFTLIFPGPRSISGLIKRALSLCKGEEELALGKVINRLEKEWRVKFINSLDQDIISIHTPIILGIRESIQTDATDDWFSYYMKKSGLKAELNCNLIELGISFYNEILLAKQYSKIYE